MNATSSDDLYDLAALALARMMYSVCEKYADGRSGVVHCNENNLNVVPDMLARLGVMTEYQIHHEFVGDWSPGKELAIIRHRGEPTLRELYDGLEFCSAWYRGDHPKFPEVTAAHKAVVYSRDRIKARHPEFAWHGDIDDGVWMIEPYWGARKETIERLGGDLAVLYPAPAP